MRVRQVNDGIIATSPHLLPYKLESKYNIAMRGGCVWVLHDFVFEYQIGKSFEIHSLTFERDNCRYREVKHRNILHNRWMTGRE